MHMPAPSVTDWSMLRVHANALRRRRAPAERLRLRHAQLTYSHAPAAPRLRVVVPLATPVPAAHQPDHHDRQVTEADSEAAPATTRDGGGDEPDATVPPTDDGDPWSDAGDS